MNHVCLAPFPNKAPPFSLLCFLSRTYLQDVLLQGMFTAGAKPSQPCPASVLLLQPAPSLMQHANRAQSQNRDTGTTHSEKKVQKMLRILSRFFNPSQSTIFPKGVFISENRDGIEPAIEHLPDHRNPL